MIIYKVEYRRENTPPKFISADRIKYEDNNVLFIVDGPPSRLVAIVNTETILQIMEEK